MSSIVEATDPCLGTHNILGGLNIMGFQDQENNFRGSNENDSIRGGNLDDILDGGAGYDFIDGKDGDDFIFGGDDIDFLLGGKGHDIIKGGKGNDLILGGEGNDLIIGGEGSDQLYGGEGKDTFVLELFDTVDTIGDFNIDEDIIRIKGVNSDAHIQYDQETGKLAVDGQDIAQLNPGLDLNDDNYEIF